MSLVVGVVYTRKKCGQLEAGTQKKKWGDVGMVFCHGCKQGVLHEADVCNTCMNS